MCIKKTQVAIWADGAAVVAVQDGHRSLPLKKTSQGTDSSKTIKKKKPKTPFK